MLPMLKDWSVSLSTFLTSINKRGMSKVKPVSCIYMNAGELQDANFPRRLQRGVELLPISALLACRPCTLVGG